MIYRAESRTVHLKSGAEGFNPMTTNHIPKGMTSVTPYLIVDGASELIEFLKQSFDAVETSRHEATGRGIMHSTISIAGAVIEVSDASKEIPKRTGTIHLYVKDVDAKYRQAIDHGAKSLYGPMDQFYGDRDSGVEDPFGNYWFIATHVQDVAPEEMERAMAERWSA